MSISRLDSKPGLAARAIQLQPCVRGFRRSAQSCALNLVTVSGLDVDMVLSGPLRKEVEEKKDMDFPNFGSL